MNNKYSQLFNQNRAHSMMDKHNIDALIATTPENIYYVSGFHPGLYNRPQRSRVVFLVIHRDPNIPLHFIIPHFYLSYFASEKFLGNQYWAYGNYPISDTDAGKASTHADAFRHLLSNVRTAGCEYEVLRSALKSMHLDKGQVGIDEEGVPFRAYSIIQENDWQNEFIHASDIFRSVRMVKTEDEIINLRESTAITESGICAVLKEINSGISEFELEQVFRNEVVRKGGLFTFACFVAGARSTYPASLASNYRIKSGDIVKLDAGCIYNHYHSDVGRTAIIGAPSSDLQERYQAMRIGTQEAVLSARPGMLSSDIFHIAMEASIEAGIQGFKRSHCGHGQGLEGYEPPLISPENHMPLEEGMVINFETPYNDVGFGGMIIEETVLITAEGHEQITKINSDLRVI